MTTRALTPRQAANLSRRFAARLDALTWRVPLSGETEPRYTGSVLLPSAAELVRQVDTPGLVVRADGGVPTRPVSLFDVEFYPDLEIAYFDTRSLAVEVKFIRDADATGSISKALGQGLLYRSGGFPWVHVVLIDCRTQKKGPPAAADVRAPADIIVHHVMPV